MKEKTKSDDEDILHLHAIYTEIGRIQQQLPSRKGKKDYSEI